MIRLDLKKEPHWLGQGPTAEACLVATFRSVSGEICTGRWRLQGT
jgi:hypothetical protein